ncbi:DEKNAAC104401 [Brettanomyces naardenensis]|uniref:DEKNAAC104401 n=1 Tax=Brettanomyces naardenensis TaxID=13370 RepID=A0A448YQS0_BRENA|nr:DEKNAAC104401 [Brettanomyces naardenensis]
MRRFTTPFRAPLPPLLTSPGWKSMVLYSDIGLRSALSLRDRRIVLHEQ